MTDEPHVPEHEPMGLVGDNVGVPIPVLAEAANAEDLVEPDVAPDEPGRDDAGRAADDPTTD